MKFPILLILALLVLLPTAAAQKPALQLRIPRIDWRTADYSTDCLDCNSLQDSNSLSDHKTKVIIHRWHWRYLFVITEHLSIGAGTEAGVAEASGSIRNWKGGVLAASLVSIFKEGSDERSERDTKKSAFFDALEIVAGAGAVAAFEH